jgi:hypothetical protein
MHFSDDPKVAEQQMHAIIFYLTTFGHIDGDFDDGERSFVRGHIRKLVSGRAELAMPGANDEARAEIVERYTAHFHEVFEGIDANIKDLLTEAVAKDEERDVFVKNSLRLRCFEIFQGFDRKGQDDLMHVIDELILADGFAHPAETEFRGEIAALLDADLGIELVNEAGLAEGVRVASAGAPRSTGDDHAFFIPTELHYSSDPETIAAQVASDRALLDRVLALLATQHAAGKGKLTGANSVDAFAPGTSFLDGHAYVFRPKPGRIYELTVLGDLHGCYSVLKATLMQSRFFEKVDAFRKDPIKNPEPKLVLLGDYIDRGIFSLNGVLRTVLQLFATAPDHVYVLRGNHEYFVEYKGNVYGGVKPSEAINTLKPHLPVEVFQHYARFFEEMPNTLLFDRMLFVHAGIPRDRIVKERWKDLSSLNDPDIRFQMMWSDPSSVDVIPAELQEKSARFPFGKLQARAFLQRLGCHTIVRGHEKVTSGFQATYDDANIKLFTLFSAGGRENGDLPLDSSYRSVTPMALTIRVEGTTGATQVTPWAPDWASYNDPSRNAFFQGPPEIEHRAQSWRPPAS